MRKSLTLLIDKLTQLIDQETITKSELSRKSGVDRTSLDKYLKAVSVPSLDVLDKFAYALDTSAWELIKPDTEFEAQLIKKGADEVIERISSIIPTELFLFLSTINEEYRIKITAPIINIAKKAFSYYIGGKHSEFPFDKLNQLLDIFFFLDESQMTSILRHAEMLKRTGASSIVRATVQETKKKVE